VRGSGFIETLLLKRVGSTMLAGRKTAEKMIIWGNTDEDIFDEDDDDLGTDEKRSDPQAKNKTVSAVKDITEAERNSLARFITCIPGNYNMLLSLKRS
jgi:hypothetical protein